MIEYLTALPVRLALPLVLAVAPYLAVRNLIPRAGEALSLACTGAAAVALNTALLVLMDQARVPLSPQNLAVAYWGLTLGLLVVLRLRGLPLATGRLTQDDRRLIPIALLFALLVYPFTYLAGIDTYKWQDLASAVRVERGIPWLIHPLSLFGFTPRSYPSAQPLLLGSIQITGALGVDAGYYVFSLFSGLTGLLAAFALGRRLFPADGRHAVWLALFYVFSPVFMRYNHWATGRGLFVALFPLFLLALMELPKPGAWAGALAMAPLLALSHKTGIVAVVLIAVSCGLLPFIPRQPSAPGLALWLAPFLAAAILLSAPLGVPSLAGCIAGFARGAVARFGWMLPLALLGLFAAWPVVSAPHWRRLIPGFLLSLPLAFPRDMYGALIALPFVAAAATAGLAALGRARPAWAAVAIRAAVAASIAGAVVIVVHRSASATPERVRAAAQFLESIDPLGPFVIDAPGGIRNQIQAYVSGCPRFDVARGSGARINVAPPPPIAGQPRERFHAWTDYLRGVLSLADTEVDWYGRWPRHYIVTLSPPDQTPPGTRLIYDRDGVRIYASVLQPLGRRAAF